MKNQPPVKTTPDPEEPDPTVSNLITSALAAMVAGIVGMILGNLRVDAMVGLGEYELLIEKERMKMPKYKRRRVRPVDGS